MKRTILRKFNLIYKHVTSNAIFSHKLGSNGTNSFIHKSVDINNPNYLFLNDSVTIQKNSWINIIKESNSYGRVVIGSNSNLGRNCSISSVSKIVVGENVLIGMNVYVSDHEHNYRQISKPIMFQGIKSGVGVEIKDGAWIGTNVVITSSSKIVIGRNSVIGANSVVKSDVPDYAVVVGSPARVIMMYDKKKKDWIKI